MAMTVLLTSEQTRDKCLLKNFSIAKKESGGAQGLKKVKKMLTQYTAKVDVVIFFHFGPVTHCAKSCLKTHKHMLSEN